MLVAVCDAEVSKKCDGCHWRVRSAMSWRITDTAQTHHTPRERHKNNHIRNLPRAPSPPTNPLPPTRPGSNPHPGDILPFPFPILAFSARPGGVPRSVRWFVWRGFFRSEGWLGRGFVRGKLRILHCLSQEKRGRDTEFTFMRGREKIGHLWRHRHRRTPASVRLTSYVLPERRGTGHLQQFLVAWFVHFIFTGAA